MRVLLTGATGYIGKRLLPVLIEAGYEVYCVVRDRARFHPPESLMDRIVTIEWDLLDPAPKGELPNNLDGAFYLVHSMSSSSDYEEMELKAARNFRNAIEKTEVSHVVYLSGMAHEDDLSRHLKSRLNVEMELAKGQFHLTTLRAGIIIGSGSASFEIIRDLVEKLPVMVAPRWLRTRCQPIGISDVVQFLSKTLFNEKTFDQNYDIGGPDILTYREMLLQFAEERNLKRSILIVPVMTPRLSSYWLYFVTSTSYRLAMALVDSMKVEVVCRDRRINDLLSIEPIGYRDCLSRAFTKIENNEIVSSWKDAYVSGGSFHSISDFVRVPVYGCFTDMRKVALSDRICTLERIWSIGGQTGWYYGTWLWKIRGFLDKMVGGVGLRRGRTNENDIQTGDALDFWRVLYADKEEGRLLLFAEMRLPGEAWLEFKVTDDELIQTATFRPLGVFGRLYWYSVWPFHGFIFKGLARRLASECSA